MAATRTLRETAEAICLHAIERNLPGPAVERALATLDVPQGDGRLFVISFGKAAWKMAEAAERVLGERIADGLIITKYDHVEGPLEHFRAFEAGHPVTDEASCAATREAERLCEQAGADDLVLLLVSGGGSALLEDPKVELSELQRITHALLASGASIEEMNAVRKHLSRVKGGRLAELAAPARVHVVALSDVLGDDPSVIASGPAAPDPTTSETALSVLLRHHVNIGEATRAAISEETPKELTGVTTHVVGSVRELVSAAAEAAREAGFETCVLTCALDCEAREAGSLLGAVAAEHADDCVPRAFVCGGETVVHLLGEGLGGRNQELALAAAPYIAGRPGTCVISVGSDGTDGPTDAAGGYVDGKTVGRLAAAGLTVDEAIAASDAYRALSLTGGLVVSGPTGTNVNDVTLVLCGFSEQ